MSTSFPCFPHFDLLYSTLSQSNSSLIDLYSSHTRTHTHTCIKLRVKLLVSILRSIDVLLNRSLSKVMDMHKEQMSSGLPIRTLAKGNSWSSGSIEHLESLQGYGGLKFLGRWRFTSGKLAGISSLLFLGCALVGSLLLMDAISVMRSWKPLRMFVGTVRSFMIFFTASQSSGLSLVASILQPLFFVG